MTDASTRSLRLPHHPLPCSLMAFVLSTLTACADAALAPDYSRDAVQPVVVQATADGEARIRFASPPESLYYAAGVSYRANGDELQVVIDRCPIRGDCTTMAKGTRLGDGRTTEVRVPLDGRRLVMIHTDDVQSLVP
ncbi:hypothetical protein MMG85_10410 [Pseudoxanthomonas sp. LH2527]|uniref:hypothetical protein n=1 Tax=Pseudoxanthomonas sp. LH2527 TaxID=2923249 RepID=UPI001F12A304|nr:hypothetical protein [Pseudoxanthomonas sp. LH2527]MCH6483976.1 hypothetical protein [Pseudoxanthomonas sp. LH2527]